MKVKLGTLNLGHVEFHDKRLHKGEVLVQGRVKIPIDGKNKGLGSSFMLSEPILKHSDTKLDLK